MSTHHPPRPAVPCSGKTVDGRCCPNKTEVGKRYCIIHNPERARCEAMRKDGKPCTQLAADGSTLCRFHDPVRVAARKRDRQCVHATVTGGRCSNAAMEEQTVCNMHGGRAPQNIRAAQVRIAEKRARQQLAVLGEPVPVENALEALQRVAGEVLAWKAACKSFVDALSPEQYRYASKAGLEQIQGHVVLWERAMDRAAEVLAKLSRVQVDERLAVIEQAKADMLAAALTAALTEAGIPAEQASVIRVDFSRRLRVRAA